MLLFLFLLLLLLLLLLLHRNFCIAAPSQADEERVRPPEALSQELSAGAGRGGLASGFGVGFRAQVNPKPLNPKP